MPTKASPLVVPAFASRPTSAAVLAATAGRQFDQVTLMANPIHMTRDFARELIMDLIVARPFRTVTLGYASSEAHALLHEYADIYGVGHRLVDAQA